MNALARSAIVALLAGAVGYFAGRSHQAEPSGALRETVGSEDSAAEVARLREENVRLQIKRDGMPRAGSVGVADTEQTKERSVISAEPLRGIARLKAMAEVQSGKLASVRLPLIDRSGRLADGFLRLFEITPAEQEELQEALNTARQRTTQLAMEHAAVKVEESTFVAKIPPFEGGADVYDAVMDSFARTLGPDRNAAFVSLQTDQLSSALNGFGAEERTITISRELRSESKYGESSLMLRDQRKSTTGGSSMMGMSVDSKQILEQYPWLAPHLETISQLPAIRRPAPPSPTSPGR